MLLEKGKFKDFFKMDPEELFLMSGGSVFQSVGAATEKDLALYVLINLECRKERRFFNVERS